MGIVLYSRLRRTTTREWKREDIFVRIQWLKAISLELGK